MARPPSHIEIIKHPHTKEFLSRIGEALSKKGGREALIGARVPDVLIPAEGEYHIFVGQKLWSGYKILGEPMTELPKKLYREARLSTPYVLSISHDGVVTLHDWYWKGMPGEQEYRPIHRFSLKDGVVVRYEGEQPGEE